MNPYLHIRHKIGREDAATTDLVALVNPYLHIRHKIGRTAKAGRRW